MSSRTSSRVVVLKGGPSAEREVSLVSGSECAGALRRAGYEVVEIDGTTLEAAAVELGYLTSEQFAQWVDPSKMVGPSKD